MKVGYPSKLRVLLITLIFSAALVLAQARRADANQAAAGLVLFVAALAATYFTVMPIVCTPVAAVKASDYPGGFSGAFKDCFALELQDQQPSSTETNPSDKPPEAAEETLRIGDEE